MPGHSVTGGSGVSGVTETGGLEPSCECVGLDEVLVGLGLSVCLIEVFAEGLALGFGDSTTIGGWGVSLTTGETWLGPGVSLFRGGSGVSVPCGAVVLLRGV